MEKLFTLITGGSMGIGKALATECAKRGMNIAIAALPGPELEATAAGIAEEYGVDVKHYAVDLTLPDGPEKVLDWCREQNIGVDFLINNAGIAGAKAFEDSSPAYLDTRIMLNIRALVMLTRLFIPELRKHKGSKILNLGSISAYYALPYKSIYAASKAFVVSFSKSLAFELENSGIQVSVVCPNGVKSNSTSSARINTHSFMGELVSTETDELARYTLDRVEKGKRVIIPLLANRILLFITRLIPEGLLIWMSAKEFSKELKYQEL
ncbi:MAG: SDR family NAD(P)-dependent oxidoreductase [Bacteroidales bacterium]|jgi:short-subunit dehydrogenase|nr:SDR family NAD(P)-dependent oxidoreductase [Bacteroidales bacterium]